MENAGQTGGQGNPALNITPSLYLQRHILETFNSKDVNIPAIQQIIEEHKSNKGGTFAPGVILLFVHPVVDIKRNEPSRKDEKALTNSNHPFITLNSFGQLVNQFNDSDGSQTDISDRVDYEEVVSIRKGSLRMDLNIADLNNPNNPVGFVYEGNRFGGAFRRPGDVTPSDDNCIMATNHYLVYQNPNLEGASFSSLWRYEAGKNRVEAWKRADKEISSMEMQILLQTAAHGTTEHSIIYKYDRKKVITFEVALADLTFRGLWDAPYGKWTSFEFQELFI